MNIKRGIFLRSRKGSVTIFIIAAIEIMLVFFLLFYIKIHTVTYNIEKTSSEQQKIILFSESLKSYMQDCMDKSANEGFYMLGRQGGYIFQPFYLILPYEFLELDTGIIAYSYYNGDNILVTREDMEYQISSYMDIALSNCVDEYSLVDFSIEKGTPETKTAIYDNKVSINSNFPLSIKGKYSMINLETFSNIYNVRLGYIHDVALHVVNDEVNNPDWIDITYLLEQSFNTTILPYDEEDIIYEFDDNNSLIDREPFVFLFANKFEK